MKYNTYKYLGALALFAMVLPQITLASGPFGTGRDGEKGDKLPKITENRGDGAQFCTTITKRVVNKNLDDHTAQLEARRQENTQKKDEKRTERDTKLEQHRDGWDQNHDTRFTKLETKATTDAQRAAIAEFKATVTAAITARRTAVDVAIATFRSGIDALNTSHKGAIDTALANLKTARQAALDQAKANCTAGMDPATAKTTFDTAMKAAGEAFKVAKDAAIKPITAESEIRCEWTESLDDGLIEVGIYIRDKFIASVASGSKPGWSVLVTKDGPLALVY